MSIDAAPTAEPASDLFTTRDGTGLRVREDGCADTPITIVFVHGWTLAHSLWDWVVAGVLRQVDTSMRMLRFDLRGHGESRPGQKGSPRSASAPMTLPI